MRLLGALAALLLACPAGAAERRLRVKGTLHEQDQSPMTGNYLLHFRLDGAEGRVAWAESVYAPTRKGVYGATLGRHVPLPIHYASADYKLVVKPPRKSGWLVGKIRGLLRRIFRPAPKPELKCKSPSGGFYVVEAGDTLQSVAEKLCGNQVNWVDLYLENYDRIQRGGDLTAGQVLLVPQIRADGGASSP